MLKAKPAAVDALSLIKFGVLPPLIRAPSTGMLQPFNTRMRQPNYRFEKIRFAGSRPCGFQCNKAIKSPFRDQVVTTSKGFVVAGL
jgi:hypothetical protein